MTDFDLDNFLPYQMAVLASRTSRDFSAVYQEKYDITIPEWRVVAHLSQANKPLSVREIHLRVDMDKSKVSRAATRLKKRGYLSKERNKVDARLVELSLTSPGQEMVAQIAPMARRFEAEYLARLGGASEPFRKALQELFDISKA